MSLATRALSLAAGLPAAHTHDLALQRDIPVPMADGTVLLADRHYPRRMQENLPVVLLRTPYGRRQFGLFGQLFAERGYQAVIQSSRGTFGSGGQFDAFRDDERDGRSTLDWIAAQSWFSGKLGMFGPSYLGFCQWAVAAGAPDYLKALAIQIATSNRRESIYPGESFALDFALSWMHTLAGEGQSFWRTMRERMRDRTVLAPSFAHLPLREADALLGERRFGFYQDWLEHAAPGDPFWESIDYSRRMQDVTAPVNLVGGWYDLYLDRQLADYQALKRAGRSPQITIGPWSHTGTGPLFMGLRESLAWFDRHLRETGAEARALPVRIYELGSKRWLDLEDWPPPSTAARWHLHGSGSLGSALPAASAPDCYDYDPADPTPSVGGAVLGSHGGAKDNRSHEARRDVLTYTSQRLERDLRIAGPVIAELFVRSSRQHTDFFVRLCDVDPSGRSINLCDGLLRMAPGRFPAAPDGTTRLRIGLGSTACRFRQGHRIRLQVSSGAHPRFSRNPGSGEPLGSATTLHVAHQEVFHDPEHPSAVILPELAAT